MEMSIKAMNSLACASSFTSFNMYSCKSCPYLDQTLPALSSSASEGSGEAPSEFSSLKLRPRDMRGSKVAGSGTDILRREALRLLMRGWTAWAPCSVWSSTSKPSDNFSEQVLPPLGFLLRAPPCPTSSGVTGRGEEALGFLRRCLCGNCGSASPSGLRLRDDLK